MRGNILNQNKFYGSGQHSSYSFKKEVGMYLTASLLQIVATNLVQKFAEAKIFYHDLDQKECWDLFLISHCCLPQKWGNLHNSGGHLPSLVRNVGWEGAICRLVVGKARRVSQFVNVTWVSHHLLLKTNGGLSQAQNLSRQMELEKNLF